MSLPDPQRSRVVLVGASTFTDSGLAELPAVRNNLADLAACFQDSNLWGLPESHCVVVADPELPDDFLDPVHTAAESAEDTLLVYYAGHGQLDHATNELLLAVGRSKSGRSHTSVRYEYVQRDVRQSRARRRVVILDCCYAGKAMADGMSDPTTAVADQASASGTYLIASAPPNKQALSPPGETHTAFTGELITLLRHGLPGGAELLDLDAIYRHVFYALRDKSRPEPQKRAGNTAGDLALARNVQWRSAQADLAETKAAPSRAKHAYRGALRERVKNLVRIAGTDGSFACPVCGVTVTGGNLIRHLDKHAPEETASVDPAAVTLESRPTHVDTWKLGEVLGGKGQVRLAVDTVTNQTVVIKMMHTLDDFLIRNIRKAAELRHSGIVRILDVGLRVDYSVTRLRYIIMEYVEGRLLAEVVAADGPMEPRRATRIASQLCDALSHGHLNGVAHGAVDARNVMLTNNDDVKVLNFGMRSVSGNAADIRSDVYDAGRLLFELVAGRSPLMVDLPRGIPAALRKVVTTALDPDLPKRYQSAVEMRDALRLVY